MDDLNRSRIRQTQQQAKQPTQPLVYRIGDRDPATGKYEMLYPDGSKATGAEKLYSAESKPGDRVLAQQRIDGTWLLSEAGASRRRRKAAPSAMPPRVKKRSQVWVLYEFEGGLWVGGHQAVPERIGDRPNDLRNAYIWGDLLGWETSLFQGAEQRPDIVAISSEGGLTTLVQPSGSFLPVGAGYWEVAGRNSAYTPQNNGIDLWNNFSYSYACQVGDWSPFKGFNLGQNTTTFTTAGNQSSFGTSRTTEARPAIAQGSPLISTANTDPSGNGSRDTSNVWLRDRYSALIQSYSGSYSFNAANSYPGTFKVSKADATALAVLQSGPTGFFGRTTAEVYESTSTATPTLIATFWNFANGLQTTQNRRVLSTPAKEVWYTNGQVVSIAKTEIDKLKGAVQNINVFAIAVDGAETTREILGFSIPFNATIYAYCGSLA